MPDGIEGCTQIKCDNGGYFSNVESIVDTGRKTSDEVKR